MPLYKDNVYVMFLIFMTLILCEYAHVYLDKSMSQHAHVIQSINGRVSFLISPHGFRRLTDCQA